eukprot:TRINITY_DN1341_c0_g1_i1.p1 TRINITY_DN1341_c0_g1~~TRINITY_DN1341_c0_g1_i1.p1  ORF type:complete len:437 (+),score=105.23 TRINITY_DN1341_c0_g1_i1:279-1589(+)
MKESSPEAMTRWTCNSCNEVFESEQCQKDHYRTDWHRYNLKRLVAGLPGVTAAWFARRRDEAIAAAGPVDSEKFLYKCTVCGKQYSSDKAHANHLLSKSHRVKAATLQLDNDAPSMIRTPVSKKPPSAQASSSTVASVEATTSAGAAGRPSMGDAKEGEDEEEEESEGEWEDMDEEEAARLESGEDGKGGTEGEGEEKWDATQCLFCTEKADDVAACVEHMHRRHGFFVPDAEFLVEPEKMLEYLGLKVSVGFMCLTCDDGGRQYGSLEAVRHHMTDKNHCKLRWGDGSGVAEEELEEFYDYSSSYGGEDAMQVALAGGGDESSPVALSSSGMELVIKKTEGEEAGSSKVIGSRELARYYKQKPRPSEHRDSVLMASLVARYQSLGLSTRSPGWPGKQKQFAESSGVKASQRAERFRTSVALKHNVTRDLPKNVTY